MSFSTKTLTPDTKPLDPLKHVNFSLGMVLGVDDFNQEFAYLSNRDQWLARDLLGYGTVCGLEVAVERDTGGANPRLQVEPGVALTPSGKLIKVSPAQCAFINNWLASSGVRDQVAGKVQSGKLMVYLTLCFRECRTDDVPVPGEPCRSDDDLLVASRIADDFQLNLTWDAPDQAEEDELREFVEWLRRADVKIGGYSSLTLDQFEEKVRAKTNPATISIALDDYPEYLRVAFRIWTTELRSDNRGKNADCVTSSNEDCVLLAAVTLPVDDSSGSWAVKEGATKATKINLDESKRPYLLHLRMLQEWLINSNKAILKPAQAVVTEKGWAQPEIIGTSVDYARADHSHGTQADPIPPHVADPKAHELHGEVIGFVGDNEVDKLLGFLVRKPVTPAARQVLTLVRVNSITPRLSDIGRVELVEPGRIAVNEPLPGMDGAVIQPSGPNLSDAISPGSLPNLSDATIARPSIAPPTVNFDVGSTAAPLPDLTSNSASSVTINPERINEVSNLSAAMVEPVATLPSRLDGLPLEPLPGGGLPTPMLSHLEWQPVDISDLNGDAKGPLVDNKVTALRGKPISETEPESGQVLTFDGANWIGKEPVMPRITLSGDVVNDRVLARTLGTPTVIAKLQHKLVEAQEPAENDVLTFKDGAWRPLKSQGGSTTQPFIIRPEEAGVYGIVAAGVCEFRLDHAGMATSYNKLVVLEKKQDATSIYIRFTFEGYKFDQKGLDYIVKLTTWPTMSDPFVAWIHLFDETGFAVRIQPLYLGLGDNIPRLDSGRLMIEVSQFQPDPVE